MMTTMLLRPTMLFACILISAAPACAGVVLITQAKAIAGNVTASDAPGFPVSLTASGSYRLASNLAVPSGRNGIVAAAPDVTIDFDGFKIFGGPAGGATNAIFGVVGQGDRLTVKNGTIGSFKNNGIHAPNRPYLIVENMRIVTGGASGIVAGDVARIQNSTIASNLGNGISCGFSCHVEGSVVSSNGAIGIGVTTGLLLGNTVFSNASYGVWASSFTTHRTGLGNNAISNNYGGGGVQVMGSFVSLEPNLCGAVAC